MARTRYEEGSLFAENIDRWLENGGPLIVYTGGRTDFGPIELASDAEAICRGLASDRVYQIDNVLSPAYSSLRALLKRSGNEAVKRIFTEKGLPAIRRILAHQMDVLKSPELDDNERSFRTGSTLQLIEVLAIYAMPQDAAAIVRAMQDDAFCGYALWLEIFDTIKDRHPNAVEICDVLHHNIPSGFCGLAYLRFASGLVETGRISKHPADTPACIKLIEQTLSGLDPENVTDVRVAITALPYIREPERTRLFALAREHQDIFAQIDTARALSAAGFEEGVRRLAELCRNIDATKMARGFLEELGLRDSIPEECLTPDALARTEMYHFLWTTGGYRRPPDHLELHDKRSLYWPPSSQRERLWLFSYGYEPQAEGDEYEDGVGIVRSGSAEIAFDATSDMRAGDIYALQCAWELRLLKAPGAPKELTVEDGREILARHNPSFA